MKQSVYHNQSIGCIDVIVCLKYFFVVIGSDGFQPKNVKQAHVDQNSPLLDDNKPNADGKNDNNNDNMSVVIPAMAEEERWIRIVQNDLENIPITITLMWISVLFRGYNVTNIVLASLFIFGRIMHTVCYRYSVMFGIAETIGFMANIIYGAFRK